MVNNRTFPSQPGGPGSCAAATTGRNPPARGHPFLSGVASDLAHFSPRRTWAMARLMVREAIRLRVLGVLVVGLLAIIVADLTSRYFDPVFQATGGLIAVAEVTITLVGMALALFLATYSVPHELTTRTVYSLVTKPVSRLEIIAGKMLGLMVVLAMVTFGLGLLSYGYILHRAQGHGRSPPPGASGGRSAAGPANHRRARTAGRRGLPEAEPVAAHRLPGRPPGRRMALRIRDPPGPLGVLWSAA
ncbi:MAG: ABC transporter permease subunit [Anaerolineaceae bacterium]|nr:ABC transporter permease subunit [Anaerolineaceae bacterium]